MDPRERRCVVGKGMEGGRTGGGRQCLNSNFCLCCEKVVEGPVPDAMKEEVEAKRAELVERLSEVWCPNGLSVSWTVSVMDCRCDQLNHNLSPGAANKGPS